MGGIATPNPMMTPPVINPILAELDAAHANLSPDAQAAIEKAHGIAAPARIAAPNGPATEPPPGGGIQAPAPTTVGAGINPPATDNVSSAAIKPAGALVVPSLGSKMPETTPTPIGGKVSPELARLTAPDTHQHNAQNTGTPGVNQIHNPWARVPLQILDALGRGFFPGVEMGIPGTSGHHDVLVHQRQVEDTEERAAAKAQTEEELQRAEAEHNRAQAAAAGVKATPKETGTVHEDSEGNYWVIHGDGSATQVAPNGTALKGQAKDQTSGTVHEDRDGNMWVVKGDGTAVPVKPKSAGPATPGVAAPVTGEPTVAASTATTGAGVPGQLKGKETKAGGAEGELPLGPRVPQINEAMKARYQVLHPGKDLPEHYVLPPEATQKDFDRTDKLIEGEEKAFGTKANQDQTAELRRQTMALAEGNREKKDATATRAAAFKAYTPAMDSAERFNVMTKNYEDAVKNHDQQAMLSLLANHIGMTMGLQKGARLTKDIIHEAEVSRPWLQGMQAKFDKDGYLTGVNLTPQQMRQMISLGRERFAEDVTKGRSEARYQGSTDEGPDRTPSKATINHYTALANGDAKKAKELAAQDGWTIK